MNLKTLTRLILFSLLLPSSLPAQESPVLRDEHVAAQLVGEMSHLQPGVPYRLGLILDHDPKWHTYWKSTSTGYATSIEWELPEGFTASGISWPVPKVYDFQGWTEYVYEGKVLLMTTITPPSSLSGSWVEIPFTADWLMCEDVCIPGKVSSTIRIPVSPEPAEPSTWAPMFKETELQLPVDPGPYDLTAWTEGRTAILQVSGDLPESPYFFDANGVFQPSPEMDLSRPAEDRIQLRLPLDPATNEIPERIQGVLKASGGWASLNNRPGISVDIPVQAQAPATVASLSAGLLLLALTGGLILNLMPCVFPVLGIKIMGFVGQAGSSRAKVISHGLTFTAGVLISFWILAAVLLILRSGGSQLGWGFQLQSPGFVLALTLLLLAFALNMSGLFEVGQSAVGVGSELTGRSGFSGSFFSGVLATVVATPCAAPFLAPALGAALTLPPATSFLVFTFIRIGLSLPYLLLSAFPALIDRLPRPGPWMETFKQFMSFLLYATVAFLLWVLAGQLTDSGGYPVFAFLKVLLSLVVLAFALWVFGRWAAYHRKLRVRIAGTTSAVALIIIALATGFSGTSRPDQDGPSIQWEAWAPGKAASLAAEGKIVYVDFTARWCVTCQTNKAAVFSSKTVLDRFDELDVVTLKADWTNQDPRISEALAAYGRSAVPFNLVYGPGLDSPLPLPELLTPGTVLEAIESAAAN
jgi:thiol:disulfide interchange protein DsbD